MEAKGVLYQELQKLFLAKVRNALRIDDNAEAIRDLKRQIVFRSANCPDEYRSGIFRRI